MQRFGLTALFSNRLFHFSIIVIIGSIVYSNTFRAPFVFDDRLYIHSNPLIKDFQYFADTAKAGNAVMNENIKNLFRTRVVGHFTLALNYRYGGLDPAGYHVFNLLVHLTNALLVYLVVVSLLQTPYFTGPLRAEGESPAKNSTTALFVSLLFVCHPVQTGAVTFVTQRFTSLAALFYLLSFVSYVRWRLSAHTPGGVQSATGLRTGFLYVLSFVSAALAMKTKEIAFTLPLMTAACEFMFFDGDARRRLVRLVPHFLTMLIIPLTLLKSGGAAVELARMNESVAGSANTMSDYLFTQFRVMVTYIRLLFVPVDQNLDYDYPVYKTFFTPEVYISFLFLVLTAGAGMYLFFLSTKRDIEGIRRLRLTAFGILWFFVTLSVESSVIPLLDLIFEHRLYLASTGFFIAVMSFIEFLKDRAGGIKYADEILSALLICIVTTLSAAAYSRNLVWQDEESLWRDVLEKSPNKIRPRFNLANYYDGRNMTDKAVKEYMEILKIDPDCVEVHSNMGAIYYEQGRFEEAIVEFKAALKTLPAFAVAHNNLGAAYEALGRFEEARGEFQEAARLNPNFTVAADNFRRLDKMISGDRR